MTTAPYINHTISNNAKAGKGLTENRAGSMACGLKVFSGLIFWLLLDQSQKQQSSAAIERLKQ
jgi:hypothetical protein